MSFLSDTLKSILGSIGNNDNPNDYEDYDCDWFCDECGEFMNDQEGFTTKYGTWICLHCGAENDVTPDNIRENGEYYDPEIDE